MKTNTQIQSYFPEAFRLLVNPRFISIDGGFLDQVSGESYPLQGLEMDADSKLVVGWLLNWLYLSHSRPGVALRVPLIVIEGPLESGKSWLLNEMAKIIGCKGIASRGPVIPPTFARLDEVARCPERLLWIFDHPELLPQRTAKQKAVFKERLWAFQGFLGAELHKTRRGHFCTLSLVAVVTGCVVDLPADLERRAVRIRLRERAVAGKVPDATHALSTWQDLAQAMLSKGVAFLSLDAVLLLDGSGDLKGVARLKRLKEIKAALHERVFSLESRRFEFRNVRACSGRGYSMGSVGEAL